MRDPAYYRAQARRARRLAGGITDEETAEHLRRTAQDYDGIVEDLEGGAIVIRHPDLMPQNRRR